MDHRWGRLNPDEPFTQDHNFFPRIDLQTLFFFFLRNLKASNLNIIKSNLISKKVGELLCPICWILNISFADKV